ncbi:penicillin-binding transpeptidase domain-containing protein [Streptomyces aidingensis]|uniref:Cell division protein FtsI/penicillin-binding protein 2 n=1 Tax=Streptomyces aidingensis TaxID=910347 RepID=A0A1I1RCB2_9ACTN|nr:penicillin-binding transpeptidase domain-containing protein [Streptomyces aidingensis]SFD31929.1 Cell division protein FtsI/penicillin-binding protein 2 [Streptomyces aidingensis]
MRKIVAAVVVLVLAGAGGVVFWLLRGGGGEEADTAREHAEAFLAAWSPDPEAAQGEAAALTDDEEAAASLLESVSRNLASEGLTYETRPSEPVEGSEDRTVGYTLTHNLGEPLAEWSYETTMTLTPDPEADDAWLVRWEPAVLHPGLGDGQTLVKSVKEPERAPILAADGSELAGSGTVWNLSIWPAQLNEPETAYRAIDELDVGVDTAALADRVESSDPDQAVPVVAIRDEIYQPNRVELNSISGLQINEETWPLSYLAESVVGGVDRETGEGTSGLQARYQEQLAGLPQTSVVIADRTSGSAVETLVEAEGSRAGTPVQTTIDPEIQRAAEAALEGQEQGGSIAVVQPSTGNILALADTPDGFPRSAEGQYAPGSGFKVVTSAALLEQGLTSGSVLGCPKFSEVNGQSFHNQNEFELGPDTTLHEAFIRSCNTAFIENRDKFQDNTMEQTALAFGVGGVWDVGAATFDGSVPVSDSENDLAASLIGQARVQTSPLVMAAVAGTVLAGEFHQPVLVPEAVQERFEAPAALKESTVEQLRQMMRDTVTEGTASALRGIPGGPGAKTGTAEFATGEDGELSTHAWMIGFLADRDLAFAVLLEDGGSGGSHAGPVAADLLGAIS